MGACTLAGQRRSFRREAEGHRRDALIAAAIECVAAGGPAAATVRAIADRAGVTPGLIRHYFASKEDLLSAAYIRLMTQMTEDAQQVLDGAPVSAFERLIAFAVASVTPPVADARALSLWAGFLNRMLSDQSMRKVHGQAYLAFRDLLQTLIEAALNEAGLPCSPARLRQLAIAGNALIDGLWLEGSALPEAFEPGELAEIVRDGIAALLHLPPEHRVGGAPKGSDQMGKSPI